METKKIKVGDLIRGFETKPPSFEYTKKYVGWVGLVYTIYDNSIGVDFGDNVIVHYPKDQAIEHLCNEDIKEFEKGLDANAKDSMTPLDTLVIDKTIAEMLQNPENIMKDIDKYLDDKAKNSGLNKTPIEELESHFKEPKLYSVLLSLGKMRMVYIDQTDEDVEQIKKQSPNWHTIIVEQQQDKGIQIIIKS
jgi:hypothetical protein